LEQLPSAAFVAALQRKLREVGARHGFPPHAPRLADDRECLFEPLLGGGRPVTCTLELRDPPQSRDEPPPITRTAEGVGGFLEQAGSSIVLAPACRDLSKPDKRKSAAAAIPQLLPRTPRSLEKCRRFVQALVGQLEIGKSRPRVRPSLVAADPLEMDES